MTRTDETNYLRTNCVMAAALIILFCGLYIFFRFVHPVVLWNGDDWGTVAYKAVVAATGYPVPANFESERMFCSLMGTIGGYLAAFVVYPVTDNYIVSFVIVDAFVLASSITISVVAVYKLLYLVTSNRVSHAMLGTAMYLVCGFVFLKTKESSSYLYWQYNHCDTYYYSVPSYLASAFSIYLIMRELSGKASFKVGWRSAIILAVWYLLNFSFLPAALLIAAVSFVILMSHFLKSQDKWHVLQRQWFYCVVLIGFVIKACFEAKENFGSGYLKLEGSIAESFQNSLSYMLSVVKETDPIFLIVSVASIVLSVLFFTRRRKTGRLEIVDNRFFGVMKILTCTIAILFVYFVLFGTISMAHLTINGIPRLDTLYVLFFAILLLVGLCVVYTLQECPQVGMLWTVSMVIMIFTIVSPRNAYSDSAYVSSTPGQRLDIMDSVVSGAIECDRLGQSGIVVHMPRLEHYNGGISEALYFHNITNRFIPITFQYEDRADVEIEMTGL